MLQASTRRAWRFGAMTVAVLLLSASLTPTVLAAFYSTTYEGQYREVDGSTTYTATGVTSADSMTQALVVNTRAGNNNGGWHFVSQQRYTCNGYTRCETPAMNMDSSYNFPSSRYGTSLSEAWSDSTKLWSAYSSTTGASRACYNAWQFAGGTC